MSKKLEWLKAGTMMLSTAVAVGRAVIEYRKYKRESERFDYTRDLQTKAWQQVMQGELAEAKVGDIQIKAPANKRNGNGDQESTPEVQLRPPIALVVAPSAVPDLAAQEVDPESAMEPPDEPHDGAAGEPGDGVGEEPR